MAGNYTQFLHLFRVASYKIFKGISVSDFKIFVQLCNTPMIPYPDLHDLTLGVSLLVFLPYSRAANRHAVSVRHVHLTAFTRLMPHLQFLTQNNVL